MIMYVLIITQEDTLNTENTLRDTTQDIEGDYDFQDPFTFIHTFLQFLCVYIKGHFLLNWTNLFYFNSLEQKQQSLSFTFKIKE